MPNNIYDNLSDKDIKTGYWYVTHRVLLRKLFILGLAAAAAVLILFGAIGVLNYYIGDRAERAAIEKELAQSQLNQKLLAKISAPLPLSVVHTTVLKTSNNTYDFATEINNPNSVWTAASFDYYFLFGDGDKTGALLGFALPEQNKFLLTLNFQSEKNIADASVVVENITWNKTANYAAQAEKFLQFEFSNAVAVASSESADAGLAGFRFDVVNKSAYNFWEPRFNVIMLKQGSVVGVFVATFDKIDAGEKQSVNRNVFQNVPRNVELQIVPDINILDPAVFKGFDVQSGEFK